MVNQKKSIPKDITIIENNHYLQLVAKRFDIDLLLFQILIFLLPSFFFFYILHTSLFTASWIVLLIIAWMVNNILSKYVIRIENNTILITYGLFNALKRRIQLEDFRGFDEYYKEVKIWNSDRYILTWSPIKSRDFLQLYVKTKNGAFQILYSLSNKEKLFIKDFLNEKIGNKIKEPVS